jgi:hypothetical protein
MLYNIEGVYGEKFAGGEVIRMKNSFKIQLTTAKGVERFIEEMKPFYSIKIVDINKNDITNEFVRIV